MGRDRGTCRAPGATTAGCFPPPVLRVVVIRQIALFLFPREPRLEEAVHVVGVAIYGVQTL